MREANGYELIVFMVVTLALAVACLTLGLIVQHGMQALRERGQRRRGAALVPLICRALWSDEEKAELTASLRASDRPILRRTLLQLALDLRGEEAQVVATLAEELGLSHRERRRLRSRRPTVRAEAAKNLGLLRVRDALPELLHVLNADRQPAVRLAAVWALGEIGGRKSVLGLLSMLEDSDPGVVRRAQEILLDSARDATPEIVSFVRRSELPSVRCAALDVLGGLADPRASELLTELAEDDDTEIRIKAVKAAASLADPRCAGMLERAMTDGSWEVRCQAVRGLSSLGSADSIESLWLALADAAWWVRFNAALALQELGPKGQAALGDAARDADPRRREVARYLIEKSSLRAAA